MSAPVIPALRFSVVAYDGPTAIGVVETYESGEITARFNDVSTWRITMPGDSEAAALLLGAVHPRLGFRVGDVETFRSGPVLRPERIVTANEGDMITFDGVDDLVWLDRRLAHPQPASTAPPYSTQSYDVATGPLSQVIAGFVDRNAGPTAIAARRVPGLTVPTPAAFGPTVTRRGRYQNLLTFCQRMALVGGLGFRIVNLAFEVFQPTGEVVFSPDLGTVAGWRTAAEAPESNYVYVGGTGIGRNRIIRERSDSVSVGEWGRSETFLDKRDTDSTTELDQAGDEALSESVSPPVAEFTAVDTEGQRFLRDWWLGDLGTVTVEGDTFTDVIREVHIAFEPNRPVTVTPKVGGSPIELVTFKRLDDLERRMRHLETIESTTVSTRRRDA